MLGKRRYSLAMTTDIEVNSCSVVLDASICWALASIFNCHESKREMIQDKAPHCHVMQVI